MDADDWVAEFVLLFGATEGKMLGVNDRATSAMARFIGKVIRESGHEVATEVVHRVWSQVYWVSPTRHFMLHNSQSAWNEEVQKGIRE